jgi:hypothetical protein
MALRVKQNRRFPALSMHRHRPAENAEYQGTELAQVHKPSDVSYNGFLHR